MPENHEHAGSVPELGSELNLRKSAILLTSLVTEVNSLAGHPIVFFDGVCGLCNRFVDWVLARDHQKTLRFTPLQGETAARLLPEQPYDPADWSIVFADEMGIHYQSDAALRIISRLGGAYHGAALLLLIPKFARDRVYRLVASNRYRWFGKANVCRIPTPEERGQFLW